MDVSSSIKIFDSLRSDNLCFAYSGAISDTITHKIIELTQFNIDSSGNFSKLKNKISFLMAECYQNVVRHGKETAIQTNIHDKTNAFFVRSFGSSFYITSANIVKNHDIDVIKEKLDRVNSLSPEDLKVLQKQVLAKGKLSEKGGAGLGIIEMARKSGKKISFDFKLLNEEASMFYLQLELNSSDTPESSESPVNSNMSLGLMISLHNLMITENILILHKGDFAEHSVLPVIQMIEKNLHQEFDSQAGRQKLYNVSVELLQNMSMHAHRDNSANEALFILGKKNDNFYISTTNYIDEEKSAKLREHLGNLKIMSKEELNTLYREKLQTIINESECNGGIGLIYIFRKCFSIEFNINTDKPLALFSLVATV